ncbi:cold-shock protein [Ciceribacter ferrooxidans]|uniref:Cold-shock protein n=1 Tax=Ciceribacter ferrooxidans TaxID=2509717 RepID=A0A4Q2TEC0_9HYPH|nr:cold-shock protein [Ciceribacter ferrooxidans]RYC15360.1 cold-shock protein [Ciceribacter ferrooxidans]
MGKPAYRTGDTVVLKRGVFRKDERQRSCTIGAVLPEAQGLAQYRVQFSDECFTRHITEADVDKTETPASSGVTTSASTSTIGEGRWINPGSIRIRK